MELVSAMIGFAAALFGVAGGYWFQKRSEKRRKIMDAIFRAMALARQYQFDILEYGSAFIGIGNPPEACPDGAPESVSQFATEHSSRRFSEADRRLKDTEKELRLVG